MTATTIAKKVTGTQIDRLHHIMDHGFKQLTRDDERLLDAILNDYTHAATNGKSIVVRQTDRVKISSNVVYADFQHNITAKKEVF